MFSHKLLAWIPSPLALSLSQERWRFKFILRKAGKASHELVTNWKPRLGIRRRHSCVCMYWHCSFIVWHRFQLWTAFSKETHSLYIFRFSFSVNPSPTVYVVVCHKPLFTDFGITFPGIDPSEHKQRMDTVYCTGDEQLVKGAKNALLFYCLRRYVYCCVLCIIHTLYHYRYSILCVRFFSIISLTS